MRSANIRYLEQVDHLRALAAVWIVAYHSLFVIGSTLVPVETVDLAHTEPTWNPLYALWAEGHTAVSLFMVLSGFIFTVGAYGRTVSWPDFIYNRVLRIYPLYMAVLAFNILVRTSSWHWGTLIETILPIADLKLNGDWPLVEMAWAVSVEFQFYLLFPFILRFTNRWPARTLAAIIIGAIAIRILGVSCGANPRDFAFYHLTGHIDQFALGIAAGILFRRLNGETTFCRRLLVFAAPAAVAVIWTFHNLASGFSGTSWLWLVWPTIEGTAWAALVLGYVGAGLRLPAVVSWALVRTGEMSFSIYLLHRLILATIPKVTLDGAWDMQVLREMVVFVLPVTLAISAISFRFIERPFLRRRRRYSEAPSLA
jgi:peptidoglycan/LPS O-acetylase OafA/YrhL